MEEEIKVNGNFAVKVGNALAAGIGNKEEE